MTIIKKTKYFKEIEDIFSVYSTICIIYKELDSFFFSAFDLKLKVTELLKYISPFSRYETKKSSCSVV